MPTQWVTTLYDVDVVLGKHSVPAAFNKPKLAIHDLRKSSGIVPHDGVDLHGQNAMRRTIEASVSTS